PELTRGPAIRRGVTYSAAGQHEGLAGGLVRMPLALQPGGDREARRGQFLRHLVRPETAEVEPDPMTERLVEAERLVTHLEPQQQQAAGGEDAAELPEHLRAAARLDVDDRIPGDDAAERAARDVEGGHRALLEPDPRVGGAGQLDHPRRQVDAV